MSASKNQRLLQLPEASVYLGRPVEAVRRLIWSGRLPYLQDQPRGKIYIDRDDLDRYIEKSKQIFAA